jgi:SAP domain
MSLFDRLFGKEKADATPVAPSVLPQRIDHPIDWTKSEIHLMLLSRFLKPRSADNVPDNWKPMFGESPQLTVERFIKNGLLVPLSLKAKVDYCNTVTDLKELLKERGLKVSGKKQELVERLVTADKVGMLNLHSAKAEEFIECSSEIRPRILQYVAAKEGEFNEAVAEALTALRLKDFAKASRMIGAYETKQLQLPSSGCQINVDTHQPEFYELPPAPPRNVSDDVEALEEIFSLRPKILRELAEDEWEPLHVVVALSHLLHGRVSLEWLPIGFVGFSKFDAIVTIRMMQFHLNHIHDVKRMHAIGITKGKIICAGPNAGSCDECMKIANTPYNLDSLPELPYDKCTCAFGCRCWVRSIMPGL